MSTASCLLPFATKVKLLSYNLLILSFLDAVTDFYMIPVWHSVRIQCDLVEFSSFFSIIKSYCIITGKYIQITVSPD